MTSLPTLNLLPGERKRTLQGSRIIHAALGAASLVGISILAAAGLLMTDRFILKENLAQLQSDIQQSERTIIQQQGALPQDRIRQFNALLTRVAKMQKSTLDWSLYLADLEKRLPPGIAVTSIGLNDTLQLRLAGVAATRDDLQKIQSALSPSSLYRNITAPVANLLDRTNVSFTLTAEMVTP